MSCKECNNKQDVFNENDKLINICILDGHEVRQSIGSCDEDTSKK